MFLTDVSLSIARHLRGHPFFSAAPSIPVIAACEHDVLTACEAAVSKMGLCVVVNSNGGKFTTPDTMIPRVDGRFVCQCVENIMVNRSSKGTGQDAAHVAQACAKILQHFQPANENGEPLSGGGLIPVSVSQADGGQQLVLWEVEFSLTGDFHAEPARRDFRTRPQI